MYNIEQLAGMLSSFLLSGNEDALITRDQIKEEAENFASRMSLSSDELEMLIKAVESEIPFYLDIGGVVQEKFEEWLYNRKGSIEPYYWKRYKRHLRERGFGLNVVTSTDMITDRVLGLLENPEKSGSWLRKGLVLGHVQSGKTANYTGLICKAADAGYKIIIVIAGIHNKLRDQTQGRIDEGFIGKDSSMLLSETGSKFIGVGRYDKNRIPVTLTTVDNDFNKKSASSTLLDLGSISEPLVFVIKKNHNTLSHLMSWLKNNSTLFEGQKIQGYPMLLVDDEADNASINTSKDPDEATRVNKLIRGILNLFEKRSYVGYTATPFANIFIDPETESDMYGEDLFPRDFIISLEPPANYMSAEKIFCGEGDHDVVRHIRDTEDVIPLKHKKDFLVTHLPESLKKAVILFALGRAIRFCRGQEGFHSSMLVNVSRFTNMHSQMASLIHEYLNEELLPSVRLHSRLEGDKWKASSRMLDFHEAFMREFSDVEFGWGLVRQKLLDAVGPISVVEISSKSKGSLDYSNYKSGLSVIAVGGMSLSRGLTLEGLTVSYFLRNSIMYDTLMQMGRWFGYRPGYEDVCRVFMSRQAEGWYSHIAEVTEELREEIREMDTRNLTPKDFGLKVRRHPESLIVTARNKMRTAEKVTRRISLQGDFVETYNIASDKKVIGWNRKVCESLIQRILVDGRPEEVSGNYLWQNVPSALVKDFIRDFKNHPASMKTETGPILEYLDKRSEHELRFWDVVFISKNNATEDNVALVGGLKIGFQDRSVGMHSESQGDYLSVSGSKSRVGSRGSERFGLSPEEAKRAEDAFRSSHPDKKNVPDKAYRSIRKKPLLLLHQLRLYEDASDKEKTIGKGVVAYGISFPRNDDSTDNLVAFMVNTTYMKRQQWDMDDDDD